VTIAEVQRLFSKDCFVKIIKSEMLNQLCNLINPFTSDSGHF